MSGTTGLHPLKNKTKWTNKQKLSQQNIDTLVCEEREREFICDKQVLLNELLLGAPSGVDWSVACKVCNLTSTKAL